MANYTATIRWTRDGAKFTDNKYSRVHSWEFDGGAKIRGSSSPLVVPVYSDPAAVDPEEAYVASLSSCHMLTFLWVAGRKGFVVDDYADEAVGKMEKNDKGKFAITLVTLKPKVTFSGDKAPDRTALDAMHHEAHEQCFIANSVKTEVRCEPVV